MSLVCPKCNTTNVNEAKFCKNCGANFADELKKKYENEEAERRYSEQQKTNQEAEQKAKEEAKKNLNSKKIEEELEQQKDSLSLSSIVLFIVIILFAAAGYDKFTKVNKQEAPVEKSNYKVSLEQTKTLSKFVRDNIKNVVVDTTTNLMWQDDIEAKTNFLNWQEANEYCNSLTLAGFNDWHLPAIDELKSIVDKQNKIALEFINNDNYYYWSSTHGFFNSDSWNIYFDSGVADTFSNTYTNRVRCVRHYTY